MKNLVLGTVQFGLPYGVANKAGQVVPIAETKKIIKAAHANGVAILDTAHAYGNSEKILGQALNELALEFNIVTKTPAFSKQTQIGGDEIAAVKAAFAQSLFDLKQRQVYALMIHHADDLLKPGSEALYDLLCELKASGQVKKIACSFYNPQQLEKVLAKFPLDLIQIPLNLFDQRFLQNNLLQSLQQQKIEVHARSIFLQGLLLLAPEQLPEAMHYAKPWVEKLRKTCQELQLTPLQLLLTFIKQLKDIFYVVGFQQLQEFEQVVNTILPLHSAIDFTPWALQDERVINPTLWPAKL